MISHTCQSHNNQSPLPLTDALNQEIPNVSTPLSRGPQTVKMTWGHELWDCYDKVSSHVSSGVNSNLQSYSKFFKEKVEIEREYAKSLRKLVSKFGQRGESQENGEQYEEELVFSSILTETGYIAGQHEMIAENIQQNIVKVRIIEIKTDSSQDIITKTCYFNPILVPNRKFFLFNCAKIKLVSSSAVSLV